MSSKKGLTAPKTAQADQAVQSMVSKVKAKQDDRVKFWSIAHPLIADWHKRAVVILSDNGETFTQGIDGQYKSGLSSAGATYKVAKSLSGTLTTESKGLLFYLWRLSYRFNSVGQEIRGDITDDFGLRSATTKQIPDSQVKKLNASQHRPLCVAESILSGACAMKQDERIASFMRQIASDGYKVSASNGSRRVVNDDDLYNFVEAHWSKMVNLSSVGDMVKLWVEQNGETSDVKAKASERRNKTREERWVDGILTGKKTLLELDGTVGIKADDKTTIRSATFDALEKRFGVNVIRSSSRLYPIARIGLTNDLKVKDNNVTAKMIQNAIDAATAILKSLKPQLALVKAQEAKASVADILENLSAKHKAELLKALGGEDK